MNIKKLVITILSNSRLVFALCFAACAFVLLTAVFLQYVVGLAPCALCIVQRVFFALVGLTCLIAAIYNPQKVGTFVYVIFSYLFVFAGSAAAIRQIYIQDMPLDQMPACLPNLDYMLDVLPLDEIIKLFIYGTAECAKLDWTLFGIGIPEWSLITFLGLSIGLGIICFNNLKIKK